MKWLQWASVDLEKGIGGLENHARCLARELRKLGIDVVLSSDSNDLFDPQWDVIHTHGSCFLTAPWIKSRIARHHKNKRPVRVFTHHGLTHERMLACHEYFWLGGYRAMGREFLGAKLSDVILSVNAHTHERVKKLAPIAKICLNAWDTTSGVPSDISAQLESELKRQSPFLVVIGRFDDKVKGLQRIDPILKNITNLRIVACPGLGFENDTRIFKTGYQEPAQVLKIIKLSAGLLSTSFFESGPLVVLEALGQGVPVICPPVGLVPSLSSNLQGLFIVSPPTTENFIQQINKASKLPLDSMAKNLRAEVNRKFLPSWVDAAKIALHAVQEFQKLSLNT